MKLKRWLGCLLIMLLACGAARSAAPVEVTLATYHSFPPFYLEEGKGLSYELAQHLTQRARGAYVFRVAVLPRKRLDLMLEAPTAPMASTASYFLNAAKFARPLRQIDLPWSAFERRVLMPVNTDPQLVRFLETSLAELAQDARWQAIFEQYGQKPHTLSLRR